MNFPMPRDFASDATFEVICNTSRNLCGGIKKFLAEAAALVGPEVGSV